MEHPNIRFLAHTAAQKSSNPTARRMSAIYGGIALGISFVVFLLQYVIRIRISAATGLSGLGTRSIFSSLDTFLPVVQILLMLCLNFGYLAAMVRLSRDQFVSENTLKTGVDRFWPLVRMQLIRFVIFGLVLFGCAYFALNIFMISPLSNSFATIMEPVIGSVSVINGNTPVIDEDTLASAMYAMWPYWIVLAAVLLLVFVPTYYCYRLADYSLYDHPEAPAMAAIRQSRRITYKQRFFLFRLDLHYWWYHVLIALTAVVANLDLLLPLFGISLPLSPEVCYFLFMILSLGLQFAVIFYFRARIEIAYALAYQALCPPPASSDGVVLGSIFDNR